MNDETLSICDVLHQEGVIDCSQKINRVYHQDGTGAPAGYIFVFGSNLNGFHAGGAARAALNLHGAEWGKAIGRTGNSWAIPTKVDFDQSLELSAIEKYVEEFTKYTHEHPNLHFFVTRVGCVLAGFSDEQIAPLFQRAINCSFAHEWKNLLEDGTE